MVSMLWMDFAFFDWLKNKQALASRHVVSPMC